MLLNENEVVPSWFKVTGVPEAYAKVAFAEDDVFLPAEIFDLDKVRVAAWLVEGEGMAFVTLKGELFVSGQTIINMASSDNLIELEGLKQLMSRLYNQALEAEMLRNFDHSIIH